MAAPEAMASAHALRKMFEPVPQKTKRIIAALATLIVMVIGTRRVTASICFARIRRISRSLTSPASNLFAAKEPPSLRTSANTLDGKPRASEADNLPGRPIMHRAGPAPDNSQFCVREPVSGFRNCAIAGKNFLIHIAARIRQPQRCSRTR
jgi:hypothetical protein